MEADRSMLTKPEIFSPIKFNRNRLGVQVMDGRCINFEDETFDVVFSYSSIEHFGGKKDASKTMQEIERVLKPGGVASITTEVMVGSDNDLLMRLRREALASNENSILCEIFTPEEVKEYLISPLNLTLFNEIDYEVGEMSGTIKFPEEVEKMPHIFLEYKGIRWGSLHLAMIK